MNSATTRPLAPHLTIDNFLSPLETARLLDWTLDNRERFELATVNGSVEQRARKSLSLRDLGAFTELFRTRARQHLGEWIARLGVTSFECSEIELELVASNDGSFFAIHSDTYRTGHSQAGDRMLSAVFYFQREPKGFSGGALRLHRLGAKAGDAGLDMVPPAGGLIVFPSWWPHEVRPVSCPSQDFADSRFSVNCWIYRKERSCPRKDGTGSS